MYASVEYVMRASAVVQNERWLYETSTFWYKKSNLIT